MIISDNSIEAQSCRGEPRIIAPLDAKIGSCHVIENLRRIDLTDGAVC